MTIDLVQVAVEAGLLLPTGLRDTGERDHVFTQSPGALKRFAIAIADAVREQDAQACESRVERPADFEGRFGGYGKFLGDKRGPECAADIRALKGTMP